MANRKSNGAGIQTRWMPYNVGKCRQCCNFFTFLSDKNRHICGIHKMTTVRCGMA